MVATVLLAVGLYTTTNIDTFVILTAFYADRSYRADQVTVGAYLGLVVIVAVSVGGAAAASSVPHRYIGLLGVIPLTLGAVRLVALARGGRPLEHTTVAGGRHRPFVVGAVTVGNGADNIAAYVPIFATRSFGASSVIVVVFVVAAGVWCVAAHAIAHGRWTSRVVDRVSPVVVPVVYLGLGISIVVFSGTLGWLTGVA